MKTPFPCRHAVALVLAELFTLFGAAVSGVPQQNLAFSKFVFTQRVSIPQTGANLAGWKFSSGRGASKTKNHPRFLPSFAQCRRKADLTPRRFATKVARETTFSPSRLKQNRLLFVVPRLSAKQSYSRP